MINFVKICMNFCLSLLHLLLDFDGMWYKRSTNNSVENKWNWICSFTVKQWRLKVKDALIKSVYCVRCTPFEILLWWWRRRERREGKTRNRTSAVLGWLEENQQVLEAERGSTRLHSLENLLWRRLLGDIPHDDDCDEIDGQLNSPATKLLLFIQVTIGYVVHCSVSHSVSCPNSQPVEMVTQPKFQQTTYSSSSS